MLYNEIPCVISFPRKEKRCHINARSNCNFRLWCQTDCVVRARKCDLRDIALLLRNTFVFCCSFLCLERKNEKKEKVPAFLCTLGSVSVRCGALHLVATIHFCHQIRHSIGKQLNSLATLVRRIDFDQLCWPTKICTSSH